MTKAQTTTVVRNDSPLSMDCLVKLRITEDCDPMLMLEQSSLWLAQCRQIIRMIARENEEIGSGIGDEIYGALTLLDLAKSMVDLVDIGGRHG